MSALNQKGKSIPTGNAKADSYPIRALVTLTSVALLMSYGLTMVITGIPIIQKDLSTTSVIASWISAIVLLVGAMAMPVFGKLGDVYGKKEMIIVTLVLYTVGVSIAGFSNSIQLLLFAQALQGVGMAMIPLALGLLTDIFPKEKLAGAQGAIVGSAAISTALGLIVGAYIVENLGWQYTFRTSAIIGVILLIPVIAVLKRDTAYVKSRVDYAGALILSLGIGLILVYTTEGSTLGWLSLEELSFLIFGFAMTILFFVFEGRISAPLIKPSLLRVKNVLIANLVMIVVGLMNFLLFYAVVYYAELPKIYGGLGFDAITTGLTLAPGTIVMLIAGPVAGRLLPKVGPKPILVSGAGIGILSFILLLANRGTGIAVTIDVAIAFTGLIALLVPIVNLISMSLLKESVTVGQGFNQTLKQIGSAIGPVFTTTILASYTDPITRVIGGKSVVVAAVPSATAFNVVFALGIALAVIIITISLAIKNGSFKRTDSEQKQAQTAEPGVSQTKMRSNQTEQINGKS